MGTIPAYPTFIAGENPTAAKLNSLKTAGDFWGLTPRCYAYQNSSQSIPNNVLTAITLDAEVYDIVQSGDSPSHDTVTQNTRIIARTAGKYEITGQYQATSNATGIRTAQIRLNAAGSGSGGTLLSSQNQSPVTGVSTSVPLLPIEAALSAGDYVEIFGLQTSGGALTTVAGFLGVTFLRIKLTGS